MAGLATQETNKSVTDFISEIVPEKKQQEAKTLLELMTKTTGNAPKIWGDNFIIGFGKYSYTRKGKKEVYEWFNVGFAPRKSKLTIYLTFDVSQEKELLEKLGKCKYGKGCLYINKLADIDLTILEKLIAKSKDAKWH